VNDALPFAWSDSQMARLIRAFDWSATPLGPPEHWPAELRSVTGVMLGVSEPMFVTWGEARTLVYNDACAALLGEHHPAALGQPYAHAWPEITDAVADIVECARAGLPTRMDEVALELTRGGERTTALFAFVNSPVRMADGIVAGNLCICRETTAEVLAARQRLADTQRRERAEAQLRAERDRSRDILESIADGMFLLGPDMTVHAINAAGLAIDGRAADAIVGRHLLDIWPETRATPTVSLIERVMDARAPGEVTYRRANVPTEQWITLSAYPVGDGVAVFYRNLTVAKRNADALAASEAEFRALAENLPNLCWIAEPDGSIYWYNRRWYEYTGTTAEEMHGWGWQSVHDPAVLPSVLQAWTGAIARGERFEMTFPLRGADGLFRPFLTRVDPVRDADGTITHWVGNNVDVSEVTRLSVDLAREVAVRAASEARLRAIVETVPVGIVMADAEGALISSNATAEAIFGHPLMPSPDIDHYGEWISFHADGRRVDGREYPLARVIEGEERAELEVHYQRGDGTLRWLRFIATPIRDAQHERIGAVVATLDIDTERRARETLERDAAELERLVAKRTVERDRAWNNARDLIVELRADGVFTAANPAWETILGWRRDEIVGRQMLDLIHPDDHELTLRALDHALAGPLPTMENRYRTRRGGWRTISWVAAPGGDKVYAFGRDVTDERAKAEQLATAREELNQLQKIETLGQLTGGVAHDFNNLLTPIVGSLDLISRREGLPERDKRLIDGALQSAERARVLVQRLLAFARRQRLEEGPVDVAALIHGLRELIERSIGPRIAVAIDAPDDLPPARADANQLELALLNLALNARDAMPDGGTIVLSARAAVAGPADALGPGGYLVVGVADTGTGMDAETARRAIEPFFSTKGVGQGTGLGLSMAHGLAAQSGGKLAIDSAPGKGTRIALWLPVAEGAVPALVPAHIAVGSGRSASILVVDDEPLVRGTVVEMLATLGHTVRVAASAEEALAIVSEGPVPDLVTSDYLMPGTTGAEMARQLRARWPHLPVLIVTGFARLDDPVLVGLRTLAKPFTPEELGRAVDRVLAEANAAA